LIVSCLIVMLSQIATAQTGISAGNSRSVPADGSTLPDDGSSWQVKTSANSILASNQLPNGWSVSYVSASDELAITAPVTASPRSNVLVSFRDGTTGQSALINILATSVLVADASPRPAWARAVEPTASIGGAGSSKGPSRPLRISLVSGVAELESDPDLVVSNATGPDAEFRRYYRSTKALQGVGGPGLPPGWFDSYFYEINPASGSGWRSLMLTSPNGSVEQFTPLYDQNQFPTGQFARTSGAPYLLSGVPSSSVPGRWESLTLLTNAQEQYRFARRTDSSYLLHQIADRAGRFLTINRSSTRALSTIVSDTGQTLIQFVFDGQPYFRRINDVVTARRVLLTSATEAGGDVLKTVSIVHPTNVSSPQIRWQYNHVTVFGLPAISAVGVPDATSPNNLTFATLTYEPLNGRAIQHDDANGNSQTFRYGQGGTVVRRATGSKTALEYTELYDSNNRHSGTRNALGVADSIGYTDQANPSKPTNHTNRLNQTSLQTYDLDGNLTQATSSRNVATTLSYDRLVSPFGLITGIQTSGLTGTTYVRDVKGFISEINSPIPGQTSGTQLSTRYVRNSLGDVTELQEINSVGGLSFTYFEYQTDNDADLGNIALAEPAYGRPLRITDALGRVTRLRYDTLGNIVRSKDALGNISDFHYNLANQLTRITFPATGQAGAGRGWKSFVYDTVGGALKTVVEFDESGNQVYLESIAYSKEADARGVSGNLEAVSAPKDAVGRITSVVDGNNQAFGIIYNALGSLQRLTRPLGQQNNLTWNAEGEPTGLVNARSESITVARAVDDSRVTGVTYNADSTLNATYVHDAYSRLTSITDKAGTRTYTYDALSNILSETTTFNGLAGSYVVSYGYGPDNQITSLATPKGQ